MKEKKNKTPKTMTTADGFTVPASMVPAYDRARDKAARKILKEWTLGRSFLEALMGATLKAVLEIAGMRPGAPAPKGNFQFTSYDGNIEISITQSYRIFLDDRVREAQRIMLEWATGLVADTQGSKKQVLLALVNEAFAASTSGALNSGKILSLLRYDFDSAEWKRAKALLQDSLKPERGKRYVRVSTRLSREHPWQAVKLDIADCWPAPEGTVDIPVCENGEGGAQ